jgi:hypothetical protein
MSYREARVFILRKKVATYDLDTIFFCFHRLDILYYVKGNLLTLDENLLVIIFFGTFLKFFIIPRTINFTNQQIVFYREYRFLIRTPITNYRKLYCLRSPDYLRTQIVYFKH